MRGFSASAKGGAGKTALTALLGRELVRQGVRVLVVDLDPQALTGEIESGPEMKEPVTADA